MPQTTASRALARSWKGQCDERYFGGPALLAQGDVGVVAPVVEQVDDLADLAQPLTCRGRPCGAGPTGGAEHTPGVVPSPPPAGLLGRRRPRGLARHRTGLGQQLREKPEGLVVPGPRSRRRVDGIPLAGPAAAPPFGTRRGARHHRTGRDELIEVEPHRAHVETEPLTELGRAQTDRAITGAAPSGRPVLGRAVRKGGEHTKDLPPDARGRLGGRAGGRGAGHGGSRSISAV